LGGWGEILARAGRRGGNSKPNEGKRGLHIHPSDQGKEQSQELSLGVSLMRDALRGKYRMKKPGVTYNVKEKKA